MNSYSMGAAAAILIALAPAASAQQQSGAQRPSQVTCQDIKSMDSQSMQNVLYFIRGYSEAEQAAARGLLPGSADAAAGGGDLNGAGTGKSTANQGGGGATGSGDMTGTGGAGASGSASAGSAGQQGTAAGMATGTADATAAPADAATQAATGVPAATDTTGSTGSTAIGGTSGASIPGFTPIQVDQLIVACSGRPDARVSDLLRQQVLRGTGGQ